MNYNELNADIILKRNDLIGNLNKNAVGRLTYN